MKYLWNDIKREFGYVVAQWRCGRKGHYHLEARDYPGWGGMPATTMFICTKCLKVLG